MPKICPCPQPPGGHIVCEDNQFGMCAYHDGKKVGGCINIPTTIAIIGEPENRQLAATNWVLSTLTGVGRNWDTPMDDESVRILKSGRFIHPDGTETRFSLPRFLESYLEVGITRVSRTDTISS